MGVAEGCVTGLRFVHDTFGLHMLLLLLRRRRLLLRRRRLRLLLLRRRLRLLLLRLLLQPRAPLGSKIFHRCVHAHRHTIGDRIG